VTEFPGKQFDPFLDIDDTDIEPECFRRHVRYEAREITQVEDGHQEMEYGGPSGERKKQQDTSAIHDGSTMI
jgi:hypothetical protein